MSNIVINIKDLKKYYGKQRGIENVDFSVEEGEIYGFIGPNGAGKTTTIRILMGLIHPTSGNADVLGKNCITEASLIAGDIGYLPGDPGYYENMKAYEFLKYTACLYGKEKDNRIEELSERLNLDLKRKIEDLSLGNKKKVSIIAALLHSPKLLILDEPTSGLDPLVQQTFYQVLMEEKQKGTTILFSSHVLSEVQKVCDRVAIIKEGEIIDIRSISDLRKNGYKKVTVSREKGFIENDFIFGGVADLNMSENFATFMYQGSAESLLKRVTGMNVTDIFIEEPNLEEIFLYYYK